MNMKDEYFKRKLNILFGSVGIWFESKRPEKWNLRKHIEDPTVNCHTREEKELAKNYASYIKDRIQFFNNDVNPC